jgi:hypothetical protein
VSNCSISTRCSSSRCRFEQSITFLLPPEDIRAHLTARQRESGFHLPGGVEPLQVDAESVRGLFEWGMRLVDSALQQPALFDQQTKERLAAQNELLETLLATLRVAGEFESTRSDRTRQAQSLRMVAGCRASKKPRSRSTSSAGEPGRRTLRRGLHLRRGTVRISAT